MKVLLLADLHSEEAVLDRLRAVHGKYDSIVVAGDLEGEDYSRRLLEISGKIKWIPGNMDSRDSYGNNPASCIHKKEIPLEKYEKKLKRKIQLMLFQKRNDVKNPELLNNILNGYIIAGSW